MMKKRNNQEMFYKESSEIHIKLIPSTTGSNLY